MLTLLSKNNHLRVRYILQKIITNLSQI